MPDHKGDMTLDELAASLEEILDARASSLLRYRALAPEHKWILEHGARVAAIIRDTAAFTFDVYSTPDKAYEDHIARATRFQVLTKSLEEALK